MKKFINEKVDLGDNVVITKENVKSLGEKIALSWNICNPRKTWPNRNKRLFNKNSSNANYTSKYILFRKDI